MKKTLSSSLILVLFLTALGVFASPVRADQNSPQVELQHRVEVMEGGLILVNDTFVLSNPSGLSVIQVEELFIGFPSPFTDFLDYHAFYEWSNGTWITLSSKYEETENGSVKGFSVSLTKRAGLSGSEKLALRGLFLFSELTRAFGQELFATFPLYPSIPLSISTCEAEARLPKGASLSNVNATTFTNTTVDGTYVLSHTASMLSPYQKRIALVSYSPGTSSSVLVECKNAERAIDLTSSEVVVSDTYSLYNLGSLIYYYSTRVPLEAFNMKAFDSLSVLTVATEKNESGGYNNVHIRPKFSVQTDENWIFTLRYSLPFKDFAKGTGDNLRLSYSLLSNFSFTARNLSVRITLPDGGEYLTSTPQAGSVKKTDMFMQEVYFNRTNATLLDDLSFQLTYKYNPVWKAFRPTLWSSFIVLAVLGAYGILRLTRKPEELGVSEDQILLRRFIELYEERLTLSSEEEKLEDALESKRIGRAEYNKKMEDIRARATRAYNQLKGIKDRIKQEMPQHEAMLRETEVAEVEIETEKTNLKELETRLRSRRISRDAYMRLREEYLRRIGRARSRIERAVVSLRERVY